MSLFHHLLSKQNFIWMVILPKPVSSQDNANPPTLVEKAKRHWKWTLKRHLESTTFEMGLSKVLFEINNVDFGRKFHRLCLWKRIISGFKGGVTVEQFRERCYLCVINLVERNIELENILMSISCCFGESVLLLELFWLWISFRNGSSVIMLWYGMCE